MRIFHIQREIDRGCEKKEIKRRKENDKKCDEINNQRATLLSLSLSLKLDTQDFLLACNSRKVKKERRRKKKERL